MSIKTDNTATLVNALAEIERLRGRLHDLEEAERVLGVFILRKQAEAVEDAAKESNKRLTRFAGCISLQDYAQRLRNQADELENNNAQEH